MLKSSRGTLLLAGLVTAMAAGSATNAQEEEREEFVVIRAGHVITMAGPELRDAEILLVDGKVRLVGENLSYPADTKVVDARQQVVMPGLIHPRTRWQLPSYSRSGVFAGRSAGKEVVLHEIDFEPFLRAGFTAVGFYPAGGGVSGTSSAYRVAGTEAERELGNCYVRVSMTAVGRDKPVLREAIKKARAEIDKVDKARREWDEKQKKAKEEAERKAKEGAKEGQPEPEKKEPAGKEQKKEDAKPEEFAPPPIDPNVLPLVNWLRDKQGPPILYELRSAGDYVHLRDVLATAQELPGSMICLVDSTSSDAHHVLDQLGEDQSLVLLPTGVGLLPHTATRVNLPAELSLSGCKVALMPSQDSSAGLAAHRVQLAELVRAGMPREEVLRAITLRPAMILGLDKRCGSIEPGKDADLIFLDGDPLNPDTEVRRVMIAGQTVWEAKE